MKIVALEEHFLLPEIRAAWRDLDPALRDGSFDAFSTGEMEDRLEDLADKRLALMDESGVDVQVLSLTTPGVQNLEPEAAVALARCANDAAAAAIRRRPDRFEGFCALPTSDPTAAVQELHRSVKTLGLRGAMMFGRTRDRNLDHPDFFPILQAIADLGVPLYLHPQIPRPDICDAYYSGYSESLDSAFATLGWGWHMEAGIQAMRLILSGTFDRLPGLQVILGHWGEMVTFWLERANAMTPMAKSLGNPVADYFQQNFYITPGGILSPSYLAQSLKVIGSDRLMFATDYPYQFAAKGGARAFIVNADMDYKAKVAFAHGNWDRLAGPRV